MIMAILFEKNSREVRRLSDKRLFIYCAGGQGRETLQTVQALETNAHCWDSVFFVDDGCRQTCINGIRVLTFAQYLAQQSIDDRFIIASGEPQIRRQLAEKIAQHHIRMTTLIYPRVFLPVHIEMGNGVFIGERVCLSDNVVIDDGVQINAGAIVGHDATVGAFSTLSPGCIISGNVSIGNSTYIGTGVIVRDEVKIGKNCIIGMGSLVTKDIPDNVVAYGSPCRVIRENIDGIVFR